MIPMLPQTTLVLTPQVAERTKGTKGPLAPRGTERQAQPNPKIRTWRTAWLRTRLWNETSPKTGYFYGIAGLSQF